MSYDKLGTLQVKFRYSEKATNILHLIIIHNLRPSIENCHQTRSYEIADICVPKYLPRFCT